MKTRIATVLIGGALLLQANAALAEVSSVPNSIVGSDTFDQVMFSLLDSTSPNYVGLNGLPNGIQATSAGYLGLGSSQGERQMRGSPSSGEPTCTDDNGGENSGCQEIAPMSGQMSVDCAAAGNSEAAGNAEGLAVCDDGLAVFTDNAAAGAFGDSQALCDAWNPPAPGYPTASDNYDNGTGTVSFPYLGVSNLRNSGAITPAGTGYQIGAGAGVESAFTGTNAWKDVLRLVYAGCLNSETAAECNMVARRTRCARQERVDLVSNWSNIIEGAENCDTGVCPNGLRRAYRRDDASGTTRAFLSFIGLVSDIATNLTGRAAVHATPLAAAALRCENGSKQIQPIPDSFVFCDGGHNENYYPDCHAGVVIPQGGDPIRKPCNPEDDVCDPTVISGPGSGRGGLVQAIKSTPATGAYPASQCSANAFRPVLFYNNPEAVCPDGTAPLGGGFCRVPVLLNAASQVVTFDCLHPRNNKWLGAPTNTDGRSYNHVVRPNSATGSVVMNGSFPEVASWRMNMALVETNQLAARYNAGFTYATAEKVCQEQNATSNIGCIVSNTACTIGFAGRQAVVDPGGNDYSPLNEPLAVNGVMPDNANIPPTSPTPYALSRPLYLNALGGFENISADCAARCVGGMGAGNHCHADWCEDQMTIANAFYDTTPTSEVGLACVAAGFIPRSTPACIGNPACGACSDPGNMCGAGGVQPIANCEPM